MDWFKGQFTGKPYIILYLMGRSVVSGLDFPLNQSMEIFSPQMLRIDGDSTGYGRNKSRKVVYKYNVDDLRHDTAIQHHTLPTNKIKEMVCEPDKNRQTYHVIILHVMALDVDTS